jgi:RimJ/RimL family protein N-acetyltransferase
VFARTERLLLRPGWEDDALPLRDAIAHESVALKLARLPWPYTLECARDFLRLERAEGEANFLIFKRTSEAPKLIGGIGIAALEEDGQPEIGYWITPSEWGKGYVTEAGRAVINAARHTLKLPRLVSGHFADNPASGRVLMKLGFKPTGKVEDRLCLAQGKARPCVLYALEFDEEDAPEAPLVRASMPQMMQMAA